MRFVGLLLILIFANANGAISLKNLDRLEDLALADRLLQMRIQQERHLRHCNSSKNLAFTTNPTPLVPPSIAYKNHSKIELKKEIMLLMQNLRQGRDALKSCSSPRRMESIYSVRRNFSWLSGEWISLLKPSCFQVREQGLMSKKENFACFAGDNLIVDQMYKQFRHPQYELLVLSRELLIQAIALPAKSEFDLWFNYLKVDPAPNPAKFWLMMAAISTSGNSGLTGWLQGVEDRLLVQDLNSSMKESDIYVRYKQHQTAKIYYQKLRTELDQKKATLKINGKMIQNWNRHNMMAAFLGCQKLKAEESDQLKLIALIGKSYESLDFISHLMSGISIKQSKENFRQDTTRYMESASFGINFCRLSR